jgi:hypothetical protein
MRTRPTCDSCVDLPGMGGTHGRRARALGGQPRTVTYDRHDHGPHQPPHDRHSTGDQTRRGSQRVDGLLDAGGRGHRVARAHSELRVEAHRSSSKDHRSGSRAQRGGRLRRRASEGGRHQLRHVFLVLVAADDRDRPPVHAASRAEVDASASRSPLGLPPPGSGRRRPAGWRRRGVATPGPTRRVAAGRRLSSRHRPEVGERALCHPLPRTVSTRRAPRRALCLGGARQAVFARSVRSRAYALRPSTGRPPP